MTTEQMHLADELDAMPVGSGIEFTSGDYIERESPTRYVLNGEHDRLCFIEAYNRLASLAA